MTDQLKTILDDFVGENEPVSNKLTGGNKANYKFIMNRNKLRAKLRAKIPETVKAIEELYEPKDNALTKALKNEEPFLRGDA